MYTDPLQFRKKGVKSTSRSGIVATMAPKMAPLFPIFRPRVASPIAAPYATCVILSI
jgi:hypothetical protein